MAGHPFHPTADTKRMKKGFYTIMSAQFFSSLADNALLVAAIELLRTGGAPSWHIPALTPMFALFYVILAPVRRRLRRRGAQGHGHVHLERDQGRRLPADAVRRPSAARPTRIVGLGAAAYSPAKYGILTELLPNSQLVKANGWIEGLTILSIILGVRARRPAARPRRLAPPALASTCRCSTPASTTAPEAAIALIVALYIVAALFNLRIPRTEAPLQPLSRSAGALMRDFSNCNARLWNDKLGQISLATTTLFWGVSGNLRVIVLRLGRGGARLHHDAGLVAGRRGRDRHRGRRGRSPRCACGSTRRPG